MEINKANTNFILRIQDVKKRTGLSSSTIYRLLRLGLFPDRVKLGFKSVGWYSRDIDAWIESRQSRNEAGLLETNDSI